MKSLKLLQYLYSMCKDGSPKQNICPKYICEKKKKKEHYNNINSVKTQMQQGRE